MPTVSVDQLTTRPDLFQFREAGAQGFDEAHVHRIVSEFQRERFDPLMVVVNPDKRGGYIVLGGHHRLEAARRLRLDDVPITVLQGDLSTEAGRRELVDEAIISNYGRRPTNIREDARAARALHDNKNSINEVGAVLGKTAGEVNKLLWFSNLPPSSQQLAVDAADLQASAVETGRAMETWGLTPAGADVVLRRMYQDSIASGKSPPPASQIRERWRQASVLAEAQQAQGGFLPGMESATDVLVAGWQEAGAEAAALTAGRQRLDRRLASCSALAAELGVDIEQIKQAASTRREVLTAEQEAKVRETLAGYREATGAPPPTITAPAAPQDQSTEEREEAERRRAREAMAATGSDMFGAQQETPAAIEQATLGDDFATGTQRAMPMGEGRATRALLADREDLQGRQRRREAVERGQAELPGTPGPPTRRLDTKSQATEICLAAGAKATPEVQLHPERKAAAAVPLKPDRKAKSTPAVSLKPSKAKGVTCSEEDFECPPDYVVKKAFGKAGTSAPKRKSNGKRVRQYPSGKR